MSMLAKEGVKDGDIALNTSAAPINEQTHALSCFSASKIKLLDFFWYT